MPDNIPAPQPPNYPPHAQPAPVPGNAPQYGPPQPYAQQAPPGYVQQPYQQPQHGYPPQQYAPQPWQQQRLKPSGIRIATGVITLVLSLWAFISSAVGGSMFVDYDGNVYALTYTLLFGVLGLGLLASGIILLLKSRSRKGAVPFVVLGLTAATMIVAITSTVRLLYAPPPTIVTVLLCLPIFILLGIGIAQERKADR